MNVLVVDDHEIVRKGLCQIVEAEPDITVTAEASTAAQAMARVAEQVFDVVVLDISLPDRTGLETIKDILAASPSTKVLVLSVHSEDQFAVRSLRAGASGYLTKESASEELISAIRAVVSGKRYINERVAQRLGEAVLHPDDAPAYQRLSDREFEVLRLIASGKSVKEISTDLNLSAKTISTYRVRLLSKLNMQNNAELTHYAFRHDLVE